jgi:uncharacterized protein (DUF2267 family)
VRGRIVRIGAITLMVAGATAVVVRELAEATRRRRLTETLGRRRRDLEGRWQGVRYRLAGSQPDPLAGDDVLVQRVRAELGPLEKQLDLPHVHVMVVDHLVYLHGSVDTEEHATEIETATLAISGVHGVSSHLHVGLGPGDTRPSQGADVVPLSDARKRLLAAVEHVGMPAEWCERAVCAVLGALADTVPADEWRHVVGHLPADVKPWCTRARHHGVVRTPHTIPELLVDVIDLGLRPAVTAESVTLAVCSELQRLVPEEVADITAVLPADLRDLWKRAAPAR